MILLDENSYGNSWLLEYPTEIVTLANGVTILDNVFIDFETTSGARHLESTNPWHNCAPIGFAFAVDEGDAYFIPWSLALMAAAHTQLLFTQAGNWVNHYLKYDAHVLLTACEKAGWSLTVDELPPLICTETLAHIIDSDKMLRGGYSLERLCQDWCGLAQKKKHLLAPYIGKGKGENRDFGRVPADILARYACADVFANRELYAKELELLPDESRELWQTEIGMTKLLVEVERAGLQIDLDKMRLAAFSCVYNMVQLDEEIKNVVGRAINPKSNQDLYDLICNQFAQPVVRWTNTDRDGKKTEKSGPSFDKEAMEEYIESAQTPEKLRDALELVQKYKYNAQHNSLFFEAWKSLHVNGVLHGTYKQNITTGRMSCSEPNEQQNDKWSKSIIIPGDGWFFLSFDYSQIEFRLLMHYTEDAAAIAQYAANPDTDFHDFTADRASIDRKPAKTINFLIGYGGGKSLVQRKLGYTLRKMKLGLTEPQIAKKASAVYEEYHASFPNIKKKSKLAANIARRRGYIRNAAGRRLQLPGPIHNRAYSKEGKPIDLCHIALGGRVTQSLASDIAKHRAVYVNRDGGPVKRNGGKLCALVHDEFLFRFPTSVLPGMLGPEGFAEQIRLELEDVPFPLSVPIRASACFSTLNWADCGANLIARGGKLLPSPKKCALAVCASA